MQGSDAVTSSHIWIDDLSCCFGYFQRLALATQSLSNELENRAPILKDDFQPGSLSQLWKIYSAKA
jgi:hypothetical protein